MFCPKCGHTQNSDELRFCSRCGFSIEAVKELIEQESSGVPAEEDAASKGLLIRQKDISIGAGLMFAGGLVAVIWNFVLGSGTPDVLLPQVFFILGFTLAFILLFFHPLVRALHKFFPQDKRQLPEDQSLRQQNGINLGAILMFIGTLKAFLISSFEIFGSRFISTLAVMTTGFLVLLFIHRIVQIVYKLLFKESIRVEEPLQLLETTHTGDAQTKRLAIEGSNRALPPAQSIPVEEYIPPRRDTLEVVIEPPSVTEETTQFLEKR